MDGPSPKLIYIKTQFFSVKIFTTDLKLTVRLKERLKHNWACDIFVTLRQRTTRQRSNVISLLWHSKRHLAVKLNFDTQLSSKVKI